VSLHVAPRRINVIVGKRVFWADLIFGLPSLFVGFREGFFLCLQLDVRSDSCDAVEDHSPTLKTPPPDARAPPLTTLLRLY